MNAEVSHKIKHRKTAKDVFYTPESVVKTHLSTIESKEDDIWLDPFAGKKAYYNEFPSEAKLYCEITEGVDFFKCNATVDVICSNPPYSCIDKVLEHSVSLNPRVISYLLLEGKMTPKRIEYMNKKGYSLSGQYICKVFQWYGMAVAYTFTKMERPDNICKVIYDRVVHRVV
jgi:hypothetical protein